MTAKKKAITVNFDAGDLGTIFASLQRSIDRVQRGGVNNQQEAQLLANLFAVRDKILAGLGTTYDAYEKSFDARIEEANV